MDGSAWKGHFPESEKCFSDAEIFRKIPKIHAERAVLAKFQTPKFEISVSAKMQALTLSHSIPPPDSFPTSPGGASEAEGTEDLDLDVDGKAILRPTLQSMVWLAELIGSSGLRSSKLVLKGPRLDRPETI